jgi:hypothetical protein
MKRRIAQMFALRGLPPRQVRVLGQAYRLASVFKHDFFAATCLYVREGVRGPARIVVKLYRTQEFFGLPLAGIGGFLRDHERGVYAALQGVRGVPRWLGEVGRTGLAIEYVQAKPLDHLSAAPGKGFFDRLRRLFDEVHARGVAYCDANKRSNILVTSAGEPFLVDYQIAIRRRDDWPGPLRVVLGKVVAYLQRCDIYHLYKHKRRLSPTELTDEEDSLSRRRGVLHALHTELTTPWRAVRRKVLSTLYSKGLLVSPTESLEDRHQPEKATWRESQGDKP